MKLLVFNPVFTYEKHKEKNQKYIPQKSNCD